MQKKLLSIFAALVIGLFIFASAILLRAVPGDGGLPLAVHWEGIVVDKNFRDVGRSLNECLGQNYFVENKVFRSNGWFSGWSCDRVGTPDVIYSLNYTPRLQKRYFCTNGFRANIGRYFNHEVELNDLEFLDTWADAAMSAPACDFFEDIFQSIMNDRRILLHCSAGRDRTGTYAAFLGALTADIRGDLDDEMISAIECDYKKTESLSPQKHGRMALFLRDLVIEGGVADFLAIRCGIDPLLIEKVGWRLGTSRHEAWNPHLP